MFNEMLKWFHKKYLIIKKEIEQERSSLLFYLLGFLFIFFTRNGDNLIFTYTGFIILSLGCLIWIVKIYERYKDKLFLKFGFYALSIFIAPASYILADSIVSEQLQLPSRDFPNTVLAISTILYLPILGILLLCLFMMAFFIKKFTPNLIRTLINNLGLNLFFPHIINKINIKHQSIIKDFIFLFHLMGLLSISAILSSTFKILDKENELAIEVAYWLDYKVLNKYPNIPQDTKVILHNDHFYSVINIDMEGRKNINIIEIKIN